MLSLFVFFVVWWCSVLAECFVCRRCCWGLRGSEDLRTFGVFGVAKIRAYKLVYVVSGCCLIVLLLYCVVVVVSSWRSVVGGRRRG